MIVNKMLNVCLVDLEPCSLSNLGYIMLHIDFYVYLLIMKLDLPCLMLDNMLTCQNNQLKLSCDQ